MENNTSFIPKKLMFQSALGMLVTAEESKLILDAPNIETIVGAEIETDDNSMPNYSMLFDLGQRPRPDKGWMLTYEQLRPLVRAHDLHKTHVTKGKFEGIACFGKFRDGSMCWYYCYTPDIGKITPEMVKACILGYENCPDDEFYNP